MCGYKAYRNLERAGGILLFSHMEQKIGKRQSGSGLPDCRVQWNQRPGTYRVQEQSICSVQPIHQAIMSTQNVGVQFTVCGSSR